MMRWLCWEAIQGRRGGRETGGAHCSLGWGARGCGTIIRGIVTPHHLSPSAWIGMAVPPS